MNDTFQSSVSYIKGVGPKRAELLSSELNIHTFHDLLYYFPYRYIDRSQMTPMNTLSSDMGYVQCVGKLIEISEIKGKGKNRLVAVLSDGSNELELIWFQSIKWFRDTLKTGEKYVVFGKLNKTGITISHPEIDTWQEFLKKPYSDGLQPMYNSTEKLKNNGLDSRGIAKLIQELTEKYLEKVTETLPEYIITPLKLMGIREALQAIHYPTDLSQISLAERRLKFEEIFYFQLGVQAVKTERDNTCKGIQFQKVGRLFHDFYNDLLPFHLTQAQKKVIREIWEDCRSGKQLNRLLQGDVGSGKTVVALMAMLLATGNGFQSCLMAPTEILAQQHYKTISELLSGLDIHIELLTGSTKSVKRKKILESLQTGELQILVGTHALIEDDVGFHSLGMVIIDEQHRFGVAQRAQLRLKKSRIPPHILVMTATPIPRTLALTTYGDLDISIINEFPHGEKRILTMHYTERKRLLMYKLVREQIAAGRQVYFVFPLIHESEKLDLKALMEGYDVIAAEFPLPNYQIGILHGGMNPTDKEFQMKRFREGKTNILVSTTVIEVGVDVPNATVMVIENAERFGLSQLHQLRGRIGRSTHKSYCILMTKEDIGDTASRRINTLVESLDGFKIAEVDLELRGPGDPQGTQQSGLLPFKLINLATDFKIISYSQKLARDIILEDPLLNLEKNQILKKTLQFLKPNQKFWARIG